LPSPSFAQSINAHFTVFKLMNMKATFEGLYAEILKREEGKKG
jgi:hypothetical protein